MKLILTALFTAFLAMAAHAETMRVAVTTSFYNSGLSEVLLPEIKAELDLDVELIVVGTGQALRLGEAGDVDAILVHARAAEDSFLAAGFGTIVAKLCIMISFLLALQATKPTWPPPKAPPPPCKPLPWQAPLSLAAVMIAAPIKKNCPFGQALALCPKALGIAPLALAWGPP